MSFTLILLQPSFDHYIMSWNSLLILMVLLLPANMTTKRSSVSSITLSSIHKQDLGSSTVMVKQLIMVAKDGLKLRLFVKKKIMISDAFVNCRSDFAIKSIQACLSTMLSVSHCDYLASTRV